jgi:hypothetical protein
MIRDGDSRADPVRALVQANASQYAPALQNELWYLTKDKKVSPHPDQYHATLHLLLDSHITQINKTILMKLTFIHLSEQHIIKVTEKEGKHKRQIQALLTFCQQESPH